jgi:HD-GYP domain-containing protein (c-di-GMP phosphodiesterase class II)
MELVRRRSDATTFVMSLSASRVLDADGEASGILAMFSDITERKQSEQDLEAAVTRLERAMNGSVRVISRMIEKRDPYTAGHEERVAGLAVAIGEHMGLGEQNLRELRTAGAVHDVGKISVPTEILAKPGKLTPPEWEMIKVHPSVGLEILEAVDLGWPLAEVVSQHHERMDGSGYPAGLVGEQILLEARILAVADVVEAMSSHRPYRPARGVDEAMAEIRANRGVLYDGAVVDACLAVVEQGRFVL